VANIPVSSWSFAIRVWLATILALFVSFWLQLESPSSAALTVAILAEPTRGQALDKAGFRLLATVVGVMASIAFTALFSQAKDLVLTAFAAWLGICVFAAKPFDGYGPMRQCCAATLSQLSRHSRSTIRSTYFNLAWSAAVRSQWAFSRWHSQMRSPPVRVDRNRHDPEGQQRLNAASERARRT
jgi:Fusaric acid resistance protein family